MAIKINIKVKNNKRGYCQFDDDSQYTIVIPLWAWKKSDDYATYYLCHELAHVSCHDMFDTFRHNDEFKTIEDMYLADFGLIVKRKKCYPKELVAFGQIVYQS